MTFGEKLHIFTSIPFFFRCKVHMELHVQQRNMFEMVFIKLLKPLKIKESDIIMLAGLLRNI